jgi:alpha-glucosidase
VPDHPDQTGVPRHNPYALFWPSAHDVWRHWRSLIDRYEIEHPGRQLVAVGEAYTPRRPDLLLDYVRPDEFHQSFCFDLMLCPWDAALMRATIDSVYGPHVAAGAALTWTLNNHDVQRAVTRYGRADAASPESWTGDNLVYTDTPVDLSLGTRRARAMITFVAALPGALYLYQGEEFGLPEVLDLPLELRQDPIVVRSEGQILGRDGCRIPLPWTDDPESAFGFSKGSIVTSGPWLPQPDDWGTYALGAQQDDPSSMLSLYRHMLRRRRMLDPVTPLQWDVPGDDRLVAFTRGDVLVVLNPSDVDVDLPAELVSGAHVALASVHGHDKPSIAPANGCIWLVGATLA